MFFASTHLPDLKGFLSESKMVYVLLHLVNHAKLFFTKNDLLFQIALFRTRDQHHASNKQAGFPWEEFGVFEMVGGWLYSPRKKYGTSLRSCSRKIRGSIVIGHGHGHVIALGMIREKTVATRTLSTPRLDAPKSKNVRNFGEHVTLWHVKHCWHWCGIVDKVHHPSGLVKYYTCLLCFGGNMERFFVGAARVILGPKSHSWEYKSNIVGRSLGWFLTKVSILHVQRLFLTSWLENKPFFFEAANR